MPRARRAQQEVERLWQAGAAVGAERPLPSAEAASEHAHEKARPGTGDGVLIRSSETFGDPAGFFQGRVQHNGSRRESAPWIRAAS